MSAELCIEGWRQQSSSREQVLAWLNEAKQLGFEQYSLLQRGHCYWLCCCQGKAYDAVISIRQQVELEAAVVIQLWQQQLLVVAWQQDTLLGACQFHADQHGIDTLFYVARQWLSPAAMDCPLLLAGSATQALLAGKVPPEITPQLVRELITGRYSKAAQLRSLKRSPAWIRRRVLVQGVVASLLLAAGISWWLWPSVTTSAVALPPEPAVVTAPLVGAKVQQLVGLPELLRAVSYLAGWQVSQWQLDGEQERLLAQSSYGRPAELLMQLAGKGWSIAPQAGATQVVRRLQEMPEQLRGRSQELSIEAMTAAGWKIENRPHEQLLQFAHFDPFAAEPWQLLLTWLAQQPEHRVVSANAIRDGYLWHLDLVVQVPLQGAPL